MGKGGIFLKTISILSLKGGVAKTTTAVNFAYILAVLHGKRVLLIDNDKQGNASKTFNCYQVESPYTTARLLLDRKPDLFQIIHKTAYQNIDIIPANMDLLEANLRTVVDTGRQQQRRFEKALAEVGDCYDYCIIDNAPDINMSIINALVMSQEVIVPILIDQYSFDGLDVLMQQIEAVQEDFNEDLRLAGCLITQYRNTEVVNQGIEYLRTKGLPVFDQKIRRTEKKVSESTIAKVPLAEYSPRCGAAGDYRKFVADFLESEK